MPMVVLTLLMCIFYQSHLQLAGYRIRVPGPSALSNYSFHDVKTPPDKRKQIVFVKVHKAASSTVHNIMLRFAMHHELDVLLSKIGNGEYYSNIVKRQLYPLPKGKKHYDISCEHIIFNKTNLRPYFRQEL